MSNELFALRGKTLRFLDDPFKVPVDDAIEFCEDGAVVVENSLIRAVGNAVDVLAGYPGIRVELYPDDLITAGFVDAHVHFPQTGVIASYGEQLLEWLDRFTFPEEIRFADRDYAKAAARLFVDQSLANGITTSSVYGTVHPGSVDALFEESTARGLRMCGGKVLMDRHAPDALCDTAQQGYDDSKALIEKWHGRERCSYVITPRFAPTSTEKQLEAAGALWNEYPDVLLQSHISENSDEIAWVRELFPQDVDYFAVYERFGLAGPGANYGHGIHLSARERAAFRETGSGISHCPTSNLFIGSGLFDMKGLRAGDAPLLVGLATDVGGGTSFSMFDTMKSAYEIAQLRGYSLHPAKAWYLATVGSATLLRLGDRIGNMTPGYDADLQVIDLASTPLIEQRVNRAESLWDVLFTQMILADDRAIRDVYAGGKLVTV